MNKAPGPLAREYLLYVSGLVRPSRPATQEIVVEVRPAFDAL
jgi:hypothetical protein